MSILLALGLTGALAQAAPVAVGAVVSGQVVEAATGAPVAGAQVVLMTVPLGPPTNPMALRPKSTTTDQSGRFAFTDLEPGRYRLDAQKAGFARPFDSGAVAPPMLEVHAGERRSDVSVRLVRGGAIAGRVVDPYGEPIVNARVMVLRRPPMPPASPSSPAAAAARARFSNRLVPAGQGGQTNDLGEFRVHSLPPGEYYLQAAAVVFGGAVATPGRQGTGMTLVPTYFPGTSDASAAHPVLVMSGQTTDDVVVRMVAAPAFEVSGVVLDEAGAPVQGAMVRLTSQDASAPMAPLAPMMSGFNQVRTDASGSFSLANVTS